MIKKLLNRRSITYAHDLFMAAISFILALYLRLGDEIFNHFSQSFLLVWVVFIIICAIGFRFSGLYRGVWRYASMNDLMAITRGVTYSLTGFLIIMFLWTRLEDFPRSVLLINWFVLMALLGGPRFIYRQMKDNRILFHQNINPVAHQVRVLLVGADDGSELFIRSLRQLHQPPYKIVGIVAERSERVGLEIHGIKVIDTWDNLDQTINTLSEKPEKIILTHDQLDGAKVRQIFEITESLGLTMARLPKLTDLKAGITDSIAIKSIAVEDLLGRSQTPLDRGAMKNLIFGRRVCITGAGGSIGSELVRQICSYQPAKIVVLEISEFNLYTIDQEISENFPEIDRRAVIADVRDRNRIEQIFAEEKFELVFHAAALKHVPIVEDNIFEGIMTNVIGTVNIADACQATGVDVVVQVSTDKAVNPTSIMGASKRIAECYCQALDLNPDVSTRFVTVRFGNVLGSTGSVIPLFQRQLAAGGPLTVTHPDMTRFFMTIREAVELILQTSALRNHQSQSQGKIYVLDMGEPVRIQDLARQLILLAGLRPELDIDIKYTGIRPGEKLYEEVFHGGESTVPTESPGILLAAPRTVNLKELNKSIDELATACKNADATALHKLIRHLIPEFIDTNY